MVSLSTRTSITRMGHDGVGACVDGPSDARGKNEYSAGRIDCDHVFGLLTRLMTAGPAGGRDPVPNHRAASKACAPNGFSGSSVRPIVISFSSFIPASTRVWTVLSSCLSVCPRVVATDAISAIPILNPDRNRAVVRSSEARQDRGHRSPAMPRRWRCLVGFPARLPASRHTRPAGPRAWRRCHASTGHGCDGRLDDGYGSLVFPPHAPRGGEPGARRPSWVSGQSIDGAWVPL